MLSPLVPSPWQLTAEFPTEEQIVFYFPEMPPDIAGQRGSPIGTKEAKVPGQSSERLDRRQPAPQAAPSAP